MCRSTVFGNRLLAQRNLIYMPNHSLIFFIILFIYSLFAVVGLLTAGAFL